MPPRVVRDGAISGGQAREDVLPVLGSREALMQKHDRRLARSAATGVVMGEFRIALERACARKAFRHWLRLDRRGRWPQEEPGADHDVPRPRRDREESLGQTADRAERRAGVADVARPEPHEEPEDSERRERGRDGVRREPLPALLLVHPPSEEKEADAERDGASDESDEVQQAARGAHRSEVGKERPRKERPKTADHEERRSDRTPAWQRSLKE